MFVTSLTLREIITWHILNVTSHAWVLYELWLICALWWMVYMNHIVSLGWLLVWPVNTSGKLSCSWLPIWDSHLVWLLILNNNFCIFSFEPCGALDRRACRDVTQPDVILCFGRAHADFVRPTIRAHIDTSSRNVTSTDSICFHLFFLQCGTYLARSENMWKHMNQKHSAINCYVISTCGIFFEFVKDSICELAEERPRLVIWKMSKMWYYKKPAINKYAFLWAASTYHSCGDWSNYISVLLRKLISWSKQQSVRDCWLDWYFQAMK